MNDCYFANMGCIISNEYGFVYGKTGIIVGILSIGKLVNELIRPLIEFCINNLTDDVEQVKKILEKDHHVDVIEYDCLGFCGTCAQHPYALVEGEPITGNTGEELLQNIYKAIEEMEEDL